MLVGGLEIAFGSLALGIMLNLGSFFLGRAYAADPDLSAVGRTFGIIGLVLTGIGLTGVVLRRYLVGPLANFLGAPAGYSEQVIELRRVHPAFVAAIQQQHAARMAQSS